MFFFRQSPRRKFVTIKGTQVVKILFKIATQRVFPVVEVVDIVRTLVLALAQTEAILLNRRGNQHQQQQKEKQIVMRSKCQGEDDVAPAAALVDHQKNSEDDETDEQQEQK